MFVNLVNYKKAVTFSSLTAGYCANGCSCIWAAFAGWRVGRQGGALADVGRRLFSQGGAPVIPNPPPSWEYHRQRYFPESDFSGTNRNWDGIEG